MYCFAVRILSVLLTIPCFPRNLKASRLQGCMSIHARTQTHLVWSGKAALNALLSLSYFYLSCWFPFLTGRDTFNSLWNGDNFVWRPVTGVRFAATIERTWSREKGDFVSVFKGVCERPGGVYYYVRVEDLRWILKEGQRNWSSGGLSASSCGAPHPKPGIYSGRVSESGDWQVSSPLQVRS